MRKFVKFKNANLKMAGDLYLPDGIDESKKYPAIVFVHPAGGVKEQTSGQYAERLSKCGFITLAFDASHQGESEGEPRFLEDPRARVEDVRCAVDYLTTISFVDEERIGAVGICGGGGYTINAAQTEHRIKAVASISAVDIGRAFREGWTGGNPVSEQIKVLEAVAKQRTAEANGAEPMYVPYVPNEVDENTIQDMAEGFEYYKTPRGQHPNSTNLCLFTSYDRILAFTAFEHLDTLLTQPILLIAGSEAGSRWHSENAYKLAKGTKDLFVVEGATHMAMYDVQKYVDQAVTKLNKFFGKYL